MKLLKYDMKFIEKGYSIVCGCDEVGYGALAGMLVSCAVAMTKQEMIKASKIHYGKYYINDSKQIPKDIREKMFNPILNNVLAVGIGIVDVLELNKMGNIRKSGFLARYRAVSNLGRSNNHHCHLYWHSKDLNLSYARKFGVLYTPIVPKIILVDGFLMPEMKDIPVKFIVHGDAKSLVIAAASIIAKVYRDDIMLKLHGLYSQYGFDHNAGYGTKWHMDALKKYGPSPVHRKHFIKEIVNGR